MPGWKPEVMRVELAKAGGGSGDLDSHLDELGDPLEALLEERLDVGEVARDALLAELEHHLLRAVDEVRDLAGPLLAQAGDLLAGADEATEGRHLLDDARVVLHVRGRRDERGELGHLRLAADRLQLSALVELVRERDGVDRLALRPKGERGSEELPVALAVEVRGVEDLADGSDRGGREQHRAQHGLLGLEVLRRDERAQALWSDRLDSGHGCGSQSVSDTSVQSTPVSRGSASLQVEENRRSHVIPGSGQPFDRSGRVVQPETAAASGKFR